MAAKPSATHPCAVTFPERRRAVTRLGDFAVGTDARLGVDTPEQTGVRRRHRGVRLGLDELPFPAQSRTEVRMIGIEAVKFAFHAAPPAALRMARFSDTRARRTL